MEWLGWIVAVAFVASLAVIAFHVGRLDQQLRDRSWLQDQTRRAYDDGYNHARGRMHE